MVLTGYRSVFFFSFMRGKALVDSKPFDPKITNIERKNRKKKKQATAKTPGKSSSSDYLLSDNPLV